MQDSFSFQSGYMRQARASVSQVRLAFTEPREARELQLRSSQQPSVTMPMTDRFLFNVGNTSVMSL
jgi:hypothetical protein